MPLALRRLPARRGDARRVGDDRGLGPAEGGEQLLHLRRDPLRFGRRAEKLDRVRVEAGLRLRHRRPGGLRNGGAVLARRVGGPDRLGEALRALPELHGGEAVEREHLLGGLAPQPLRLLPVFVDEAAVGEDVLGGRLPDEQVDGLARGGLSHRNDPDAPGEARRRDQRLDERPLLERGAERPRTELLPEPPAGHPLPAQPIPGQELHPVTPPSRRAPSRSRRARTP